MTTTATTTLSELKKKIESRQARIGIVGMGYVGLPLALLFSGERFDVTGFDIEERKVSTLNAGGSYIVRILPECHPAGAEIRLSAPQPITPKSRRWTRSSSASPRRSTSTMSPI